MFGKQKETLPEDQVHLKPILGIQPGVYLSIGYALALFFIGFLVLLYPGLVNPGAILALESEPAGAAVRVDDVYMGTTPCEVFVPRGEHRLDMVLPGFTAASQDIVTEGRAFASLFSSAETIAASLSESADAAALTLGASEFAAWSFTGEPTSIYQIPRALSEGAYRSGALGENARGDDILRGAARFASTRAGLRELVRAKTLVDNGGCSVSPLSLLSSIEAIMTYLSETPGSAVWLATLLPKEQSETIVTSAWYGNQLKQLPTASVPPKLGVRVELDAIAFREVPAGTLVQKAALPHAVVIQPFLIAENVVSSALWEQFLAETPDWRDDNLATLLAEALVSEDYRLTLDEQYDMAGVTSVSWHAANAFCAWLSAKLPPNMADLEARLPTEAEWEYAATSEDSASLSLGDFWEWCADPYAPYNFLPARASVIEAIASPERAVRGGSWVNQAASQSLDTRASLPPAFCSPFVSFRPVLAPKGGRDE
ncbi:MAG: SUMF1/EgtB/PvdO family nonheme iron enzyme [Treponema sp.]|jgi:hypothetical protein|nr:SUMF1/EgtB/PvdO family nonheme iron enzyme [Treponema sp.]